MILIIIGAFLLKRTLGFILQIVGIISQNSMLDRNLDVNENLPPYWNCIPGEEQKVWYTKEVYIRELLDLKTVDDKQLEELRTQIRGQKKF